MNYNLAPNRIAKALAVVLLTGAAATATPQAHGSATEMQRRAQRTNRG
jgi:hypothetical protein